MSPGCAHCYIVATPAFRIAGRQFVAGSTDIRFHTQRLPQPLSWRRPRRIFVNSLSDLFHEDIPDEFIARVYGVMVAAYWHEFQVLTKRPARRLALLRDEAFREQVAQEAARLINTYRAAQVITARRDMRLREMGENLVAWNASAARNTWEGATAENQGLADKRIPELLDTPAAVRWLSCEPLLEPVDIQPWLSAIGDRYPGNEIDWVVVGGESGPGARPCNEDWIRGIVQQCQSARVPVFCKQLGASNRCPHDRKGGHFECFPPDLRVREYPEVGR